MTGPAAAVILPTREGYDRWAEIYDGEGNPLIALEEPEVDRLLGPVNGLEIADIGCGTGRVALRLALRGARVTGIDFSEGMLAQARKKPGAASVRFVQHDLGSGLPLGTSSFDRVTCCLVVDHVPDLRSLFAELGRICRPEGSILVSVMHPAMMLRGVQARFVDAKTGQETRPESCPHQISDYVMAAVKAGLTVSQLSEHAVGPELAARVPRAQKYLAWPLLFVMLLRG